ncbi:hypothetical protein [Streptomyces sp. NPDC002491]
MDGWEKDDPRFVLLLAGLQEIMPWVHPFVPWAEDPQITVVEVFWQ